MSLGHALLLSLPPYQSIETLETLTNDKATLEVQLATQQKLIASMREELGMSKEERAMAQSLSESRGAQVKGGRGGGAGEGFCGVGVFPQSHDR